MCAGLFSTHGSGVGTLSIIEKPSYIIVFFWMDNFACKVLTGYCGSKTVVTGNAVAEFVAMVLLPLLFWLDITWVLEQPLSSLFFEWPKLKPLMINPHVMSVVVDLSIFGCLCPKQLVLKGTWRGLEHLKAIESALKAILPSEQLAVEVKASKESGRLGRYQISGVVGNASFIRLNIWVLVNNFKILP